MSYQVKFFTRVGEIDFHILVQIYVEELERITTWVRMGENEKKWASRNWASKII
jgi:hypothetical protein